MPAKTILIYICLLCLFLYRLLNYCGLTSVVALKCESLELPSSSNAVVGIHNKYDSLLRKHLPSPHEELLLGMTIGADYLSRLPKFSQSLKDSGTIHVAVVSGFNINLVFNFLISILGSKYRFRNYLIAITITFLYALLSGFEPPVVRSWIMGSTLALGRVYGRLIKPVLVLLISALFMLILSPAYLFSLSFQLSFFATLGLILYSEILVTAVRFMLALFYIKKEIADFFVFTDLISSISAQLLVWPLISYNFGTLSIISPLTNSMILWTIPIATILGFSMLITAPFSNLLTSLLSNIVFVFIDVFVKGVNISAKLPFASVNFSLTFSQMLFYYIILGVITLWILRKKNVVSYENKPSSIN